MILRHSNRDLVQTRSRNSDSLVERMNKCREWKPFIDIVESDWRELNASNDLIASLRWGSTSALIKKFSQFIPNRLLLSTLGAKCDHQLGYRWLIPDLVSDGQYIIARQIVFQTFRKAAKSVRKTLTTNMPFEANDGKWLQMIAMRAVIDVIVDVMVDVIAETIDQRIPRPSVFALLGQRRHWTSDATNPMSPAITATNSS